MFGFMKRRTPVKVEPIDPVIAARVDAGARLMDSRAPGWHNHIDTDTLDLASNYQCVLGQTYGSYTVGAYKVFGFFGTKREKSMAHGFDVERDSSLVSQRNIDREFNILTRAWCEEISDRRALARR